MAMPTIEQIRAIGPVVTGLLTLVASIVIAWFAGRIASRQAHTAELARRTAGLTLRLQMFPLRIAVFDTVSDAVARALSDDYRVTFDDGTRLLHTKVREARFLFKASTFEHLRTIEVRVMAFRQIRVTETKRSGYDAARQEEVDKMHALGVSLVDDLNSLAQLLESELKIDDAASFSTAPSSDVAAINADTKPKS